MKIYLTEMEVYGKVFAGPNIVASSFEKADEAASQSGLTVIGELDSLVVNDDDTWYPVTVDTEKQNGALMAKKKDPRLARAGVSGYNKPKRTPNHPKKSHIVVAKEGDKIKTIRFGQKGAKTAGKPKAGESARMKAKRKSFKARHAKNIKRGKMSAAYWADKVKW